MNVETKRSAQRGRRKFLRGSNQPNSNKQGEEEVKVKRRDRMCVCVCACVSYLNSTLHRLECDFIYTLTIKHKCSFLFVLCPRVHQPGGVCAVKPRDGLSTGSDSPGRGEEGQRRQGGGLCRSLTGPTNTTLVSTQNVASSPSQTAVLPSLPLCCCGRRRFTSPGGARHSP